MSKSSPSTRDVSRPPAQPTLSIEALFTEPLIEGQQVLHLLSGKHFTLEETGIAPRTYYHWRSERLLPENTPAGKVIELDLSGFAWLKVVEQLIGLGQSFELIRQIQSQLFAPLTFQDLHALLQREPKAREEAPKILARSPLPDEEIGQVLALLNGEALGEIASVGLPLFSLLVVQTLTVKQMARLLILPSGQVLPLLDEMQLLDAEVQKLTLLPHLSLSLYSLLEPFLAKVPVRMTRNLTQSAFSLSGEEYHILRTMREGNLNEVRIRFDENHLPSVMLGVQGQHVNENDKALLTHLLIDSKHYEVNKKHNHNGHAYVERTFRKRLRPKQQ